MIAPELQNPTPLAKQIWQDIWTVSGETPENCLYTFVEIFIFKYLSDLEVLKGTHNFYSLISMHDDNTDNEVQEYYANTVRPKIKQLFPKNTKDICLSNFCRNKKSFLDKVMILYYLVDFES